MSEELGMVRRMWHLFEPIYSTIFYAPQAWELVAELGYPVDARWPSPVAWRAAPLGPVGPEVVTATHYVFNPRFVAEHVPACWRVASPETVLRARRRAIDRAFRALLGDRVDGPELAEAADLAMTAARSRPRRPPARRRQRRPAVAGRAAPEAVARVQRAARAPG